VRAAGLVVFVTTVLSGLDYLITFARRAWTAPPRPA